MDNRQRYLQYDDVFMTSRGVRRSATTNSQKRQRWQQQNRHPADFEEDYDSQEGGVYELYDNNYDDQETKFTPTPPNYVNRKSETPYFSQNSSIINEKMMQYKPRQLPSLQRYNNYKNVYPDLGQSYWDEDDEPRRRSDNNTTALAKLWHKFIVTFAVAISLVCVSWIAYNWNNNDKYAKQTNTDPLIIGPDRPSFKVLPRNPGGEEVSYKDKTIYEKMTNEISPLDTDEKLLPPQEEQTPLPRDFNQVQAVTHGGEIEEYSIIEDKIYYIKISAGKSKIILDNEAKLLKKKFTNLLYNKSCSVKKVSNSTGEQKYAVLIGPYKTLNEAVTTARDLGEQCSVISVKE
jgi:hypothetical protein